MVEYLQETALSLGLELEVVWTLNANVLLISFVFKNFIGRFHIQQYVEIFKGLANVPVEPLKSPIQPKIKIINNL